jgi:hypothetical protein
MTKRNNVLIRLTSIFLALFDPTGMPLKVEISKSQNELFCRGTSIGKESRTPVLDWVDKYSFYRFILKDFAERCPLLGHRSELFKVKTP